MKNFILYETATGEIKRWGSCQDDDYSEQHADGLAKMEFEANNMTHYVKDGEPVAYTPEEMSKKMRTSLFLRNWNNETMEWTA